MAVSDRHLSFWHEYRNVITEKRRIEKCHEASWKKRRKSEISNWDTIKARVFFFYKRWVPIWRNMIDFSSVIVSIWQRRIDHLRFQIVYNSLQTQLVCFSNLRLFIISVTDYIKIVADFYRSLLSANLSVNIKISAREKGISSLSCRLRHILGSHFEFLFTYFKPRDQIAKRVN